jgi:hypothetical protein
MSAIENYNIDFVARTKQLIDQNFAKFNSEDLEVTFLLNCLLGLIITVLENEKRKSKAFTGKIDDDFLSYIPQRVGYLGKSQDIDLTLENSTDIQTKVEHYESLKTQDKIWFINKLRNGIAHQHIQPINQDGKWVGIKLWNVNINKKDFEIIFTIDQLKSLSIKIADVYFNFNKVSQ